MASNIAKIRFLTTTQVTRLHNLFISPAAPSQPALLESAVNSPLNVKYYANQQNVFQLAANLSEKIIKNHAFLDGNKRTALLAADMFLKINGYNLQKAPLQQDSVNESIASAHLAVCVNTWTAEDLGLFYEQVATPIETWTPEILEFRNTATEL